MEESIDGVKSPLFRFYSRECTVATNLLSSITSDLASLVAVCSGTLKQTNDLRSLLSDLTRGVVPPSWRRYKCRSLPAGAWIVDFSKRIEQLERIVKSGALRAQAVELGLLFYPNSYLTATRQTVAHATGISMEQLVLKVDLGSAAVGEDSFAIDGELPSSSHPLSLD